MCIHRHFSKKLAITLEECCFSPSALWIQCALNYTLEPHHGGLTPTGISWRFSSLGCMQGQGVKVPDSSREKIINVELGRQDLTCPLLRESKRHPAPDELPLEPKESSSSVMAQTLKKNQPPFPFFFSLLKKIPCPVHMLGINKKGGVLNAG